MACVVILTAIPIEYEAVGSHLTDLQEKIHPQGTVYEQGQFTANGKSWKVGIVEIGAGNSGAAMEAERAIAYFNPSVILFVGVAGGIKDVALGDVVAATKVYGYESGKAKEEFEPRSDVGESAYNLIQRARAEGRKTDWCKRLTSPPHSTPKVLVAPLAAGAKVVASKQSEVFHFLQSHYGDAVAVEMEGRGFLQATHANHQVSALIVRGISDLIDGKSSADAQGSQKLAAYHASAFAFEVLAKLQPQEFNSPSSPERTNQKPINLTGTQRQQFREALIDAFPKKKALEIMLSDKLNLVLDTIAGGDNYQEIVFDVIKWFQAQGRLNELLEAAKRANPDNSKLKELNL